MTYDELSAISRLNFPNLKELITQGIMPDGHPAGTQLFLYFWTHLFGLHPALIKLPFLLFSLSSIFLIYKLGKLWFNPEVGLLASALSVSMQAFLFYGQLARPYSPGLFFTLVAAYFWSKYLFEKRSIFSLSIYILSATAAAYTHHFALLFVAILGVTGFFFLRKNERRDYFKANLLIFILYIPHLPIFWAQLKIGGIGGAGNWLKTPKPTFIVDYIAWLFHYSYWFGGAFIAALLLAFFFSKRADERNNLFKKRIVLLLWFLLPLLIGYAYSIWINPVLQYSVLLFSLPYVLFLIFSFTGSLNNILKSTLVFLLISSSAYSLLNERHYNSLFYNQPFKRIVQLAMHHEKEESVFIFSTIPSSFLEYHFALYHHKTPFYSIYNQNLSIKTLDSIFSKIQQESVLVAGLQAYQIESLKKYFPYLITQEDDYTYRLNLYSKKAEDHIPNHNPKSKKLDNSNWKYWKHPKSNWLKDSTCKFHYLNVRKTNTWPISFRDSLKSVIKSRNNEIEIAFDVKPLDSVPTFVFIIELEENNKRIAWRGLNAKNYPLAKDKWSRLYFSMDLSLVLDRDVDIKQLVLKTYIWNKNKNYFALHPCEIKIIKANPFRYGLFEKIED